MNSGQRAFEAFRRVADLSTLCGLRFVASICRSNVVFLMIGVRNAV